MRTALYIVVFKFFLVGMVFGQGHASPYVEKINVSGCKNDCVSNQFVSKNELVDGVYYLNMMVWANCSEMDTVLILLDSDTLILNPYSSSEAISKTKNNSNYIKYKKGPKSFICDCLYELKVEMGNMNSLPKCIKFDGQYWNGQNFSNIELFKRHGWKTFRDNSEKLIFNELKNCLGKDVNDSLVTTILKGLGNDSIVDFSECCFSYEYPSDGIVFVFTKDKKLWYISLMTLWEKQAKAADFISEKKSKNDKKFSKPYEKYLLSTIYDEKGNERCLESVTSFYEKEKLEISYDMDGKIDEIRLIELIENK